MKIFVGKYAGRNIEDLPSQYLVWILEEFEGCEHTMREACKKELSARLKLDFDSPNEEQLFEAQQAINKLKSEIDHLRNVLVLSQLCKGNRYLVEGFESNPELAQSELKLINHLYKTKHGQQH